MNGIQKRLLDIVGAALFGGEAPETEAALIGPLFRESAAQTVFPLVFSAISDQAADKLPSGEYEKYRRSCLARLGRGVRNFAEHGELDGLMAEAGVPYAVIKGYASASYYPDPSLRDMGDVDFVVRDADAARAGSALKEAGFILGGFDGDRPGGKKAEGPRTDAKNVHGGDGAHADENGGVRGARDACGVCGDGHIAYHRPPASVWELHLSVKGIPQGEPGRLIREYLSDLIDTSTEVGIDGSGSDSGSGSGFGSGSPSGGIGDGDGGVCRIPDRFHHGLILLVHTAAHLTGEGVGLRHLCDWAVFVSSFGGDGFAGLFEERLKACGLWRFAVVLTLLCARFLGAPGCEWAADASRGEVSDGLLYGLADDILNGGNFGKKDKNRYREIKYITSDSSVTVGGGGIVPQGFRSLNDKVRRDFRFIGRHRPLYPVGWAIEGGRYAGKLMTGKRRSSGTREMLREAARRKKLYGALRLFDVE